MAITRIRGGQLQDRTIDGIKLKTNSLSNEHIAAGASIDESKLNIDWAMHGQEALQSKKVVDYIQVTGTDVSGVSSVNVSGLNIFGGSNPAHTNSDPLSAEGIIVDSPKNKVAIRDSLTGEPILDSHGHEVFGRMTFNNQNNSYELNFYTEEDGSTLVTPVPGIVEVEFTMPMIQTIDWQYAQRFNLQTINEMFAANEKFVEGTADATAHLNIEQLAKDLYGSSFSLDRDGNGNLVRSLVDQISDEITARQTEDINLQNNIDAEADARANADTAIRNDLAGTTAGKGANIIGVEDAANKFTSSTVEGVLKELNDRTEALESGSGNSNNEIIEARSSNTTGNYSSLDERLEASETRYEAVRTEVVLARGSEASLNNRLNEIVSSISNEISRSTQADTNLQDNINAFDARFTNLQDAILNEEKARQLADGTLQDNINNLSTDVSNYITSNDTRVQDIEDVNTTQTNKISSLETEVQTSRGSKISLNERLSVALNPDGTLKLGNVIHTHKKYIETVATDTTIISMPVGEVYTVGDGSLSVYVNGILQANGINFTEVAGGASIDFGSDQLLSGDIVVVEYIVYG